MPSRAFALCLVASLAACAASGGSAPEPGYDAGRDVTRLIVDEVLAPSRVQAFARDGGEAQRRNEIVLARVAEIDRFYFAFERAAVARGGDAAVARRRAQRDAQRREIELRLAEPVADWPLAAAASALEAYYHAGAFAPPPDNPAAPVILSPVAAPTSPAGARARIAALVKGVRAASDAHVRRLAVAPPMHDANSRLILNAYGDAARDDAAVARIALIAALEEMARSDANLAAWETALSGSPR